jgi:rRNA maturation protein Nop10
MANIEQGFGWHYPPGTPGPRSEPRTFKCAECDNVYDGQIIYDLGTADLVPESCPECGEDTYRATSGPYEPDDNDDAYEAAYERAMDREADERGR